MTTTAKQISPTVTVFWVIGNIFLGFIIGLVGIWRQTALPFLYLAEVIVTTVLMIRWQKMIAPPISRFWHRTVILVCSWALVTFALMVVAKSFYPVMSWHPVGLSSEEYEKARDHRSTMSTLITFTYIFLSGSGSMIIALSHHFEAEKAKKLEAKDNPVMQP